MKLSATQKEVLDNAFTRDNNMLEPLPARLKGNAADTVIQSLLNKGAVETIDDILFISSAGLVAIGQTADETKEAIVKEIPTTKNTEEKQTTPKPTVKLPRAGTKQARVIEMLKTPDGITIEAIATEMNWQKHTTLGLLHGSLKKRFNLYVISEKNDQGQRVYRLPL
jgi:hypothetical protein